MLTKHKFEFSTLYKIRIACSIAYNGKNYPTNRFTILEPNDQEIGEFYVAKKRRATDFEIPKLWECSLGRRGLQTKCLWRRLILSSYNYTTTIHLL